MPPPRTSLIDMVPSYDTTRHTGYQSYLPDSRILDGDGLVLPSVENPEHSPTTLRWCRGDQNIISNHASDATTSAHRISPQLTRRRGAFEVDAEMFDLARLEGQSSAKRPRLENPLVDPTRARGPHQPVESSPYQESGRLAYTKLSDDSSRGRDSDISSTMRQRPVPQFIDLSDQPHISQTANVHAHVPVFRGVYPSRSIEMLRHPAEVSLAQSDRVPVSNTTYLRSFHSLQSPRFISPPRKSSSFLARENAEPRGRENNGRSLPLELVSNDHASHQQPTIQTNGNPAFEARPSMMRHEAGRMTPVDNRVNHMRSPRYKYQDRNTHRRQEQKHYIEHIREHKPVDQVLLAASHLEDPIGMENSRGTPYHVVRHYASAPSFLEDDRQAQYPTERERRPLALPITAVDERYAPGIQVQAQRNAFERFSLDRVTDTLSGTKSGTCDNHRDRIRGPRWSDERYMGLNWDSSKRFISLLAQTKHNTGKCLDGSLVRDYG